MQQSELDAIYDDLRQVIAARLNVRARSFHRAVHKAGRLLPARARHAARDLRALEDRIAHPKLAQKVDPQIARDAAETIRTALVGHKPGAKAARDRSFLLADIGLKVLLFVAIVLIMIYWRGSP